MSHIITWSFLFKLQDSIRIKVLFAWNPRPCLANLILESNLTWPRNPPPLQKDKLSYKFSNQNSKENQTHQSTKSVGQTQISLVDLYTEGQKALKNDDSCMIAGLAKKHRAFHFLSSLSTFSLYPLNIMDSVAHGCSPRPTRSHHSPRLNHRHQRR